MNKKLLLGLALAFNLIIGQSYASEPEGDTFDQTRENSVLESYNRAMFDFNNYFYHYLLMPVARGYRYVTTPSVRRSVRNSLDNIREPLSTGNFLLQGNLKESGITLARFAINSTLGLFGLFDVAEGWGLKKKTTGFDETFAKWCIPDGPYLVLPLIGSATPRSTVGMGLGFVFDPVYWGTRHDANVSDKATYAYAALQAITIMEANMDFLNDLERNSVDYYTAVRSAYLQNRKNMGCGASEEDANLTASYDFDFDIE